MKLKKVMATFTALTVGAVSLAGCGSEPATPAETGTETTPAETTNSGEQVTLRFSWWGGDARHEATLKVIEAFEAANPNINIEPEYSAYDGYAEKKNTEFASETAPDIFQIETGAGPEYYTQGVLYNLSETSIDFSSFDPTFLEKNGQFGSGSQYAIPTGQAGTALLVNKTLADQIGIDFSQPYTWDQLLEWGKKVQEYDPEMYLLSANTIYSMPFFVRAWARQVNADGIINDETKSLNMTEEQFVECFSNLNELYRNNVCAPAEYKAPFGEAEQEDPNWIAGKYVASVGYTSTVPNVSAANPNVEYMIAQLPLMEGGKSDGWFNDTPQYIGMYANTKYPAEAAKFLDFFYNNEEAIKMLGTVRSIPPHAKAQGIVEAEGILDPLSKQSVEVSMKYNGESDGGLTTSAEVKAILEEAYENIAYGAKTPEEVSKEVVSLLNDFISTR